MQDIVTSIRLVGLPGSLRKASFSRATLLGLRNNLPEKVSLKICDLQLPLYNEDEDRVDAPAEVRRLKEAIADSHGIVIATPEYNHGIPGVLKNALASVWKVRADRQAGPRDISLAGVHGRGARSCAGQ
jgi:chromate reductase, NAD(P)H dehydrogenase (quinone)